MIGRIIDWCAGNRFLVLTGTVVVTLWGVWALWRRRNGQRVVGVVSAVMAVVVLVWFMVTSTFPRELTGMTPYLATLIVLAFATPKYCTSRTCGQWP